MKPFTTEQVKELSKSNFASDDTKLSEIIFFNDKYHGTVYTESYAVIKYNGCITITELENAQKRGKEVTEYSISSYNRDYFATGLYNYLVNTSNPTIKEFLENDFGTDLEIPVRECVVYGTEIISISFSKRQAKGVDIYSPYFAPKPLKTMPKNWNLNNLLKVLHYGQYTELKRNYKHTDDYYYDAQTNYSKGEIKNPIELIKKMYESKYWFKMIYVDEQISETSLRLSFGSFTESFSVTIDLEQNNTDKIVENY